MGKHLYQEDVSIYYNYLIGCVHAKLGDLATRTNDFVYRMNPIGRLLSNLKQGSLVGSVLCVLETCLGVGIITLPYLSAQNGIVLAVVLIIFGAVISYFCGMLLVE